MNELVAAAPVFLLVAVRALAMIETAPLLSSDAIPQAAKVALAGFASFIAFGSVPAAYRSVDAFSLSFVALVVGEALIGVIIGFFLNLVFSAFSSAGQFFSLQMGFGASETYDPLAQIENPLMGQYLNLIAMLAFLTSDGFQRLFLGGFQRSLQSMNAATLLSARDGFLSLMLTGLSNLFVNALIIAMPILGTLFMVSVSMGLLSKAAPQMNILSEGFPISITVAFALIMVTMPFLMEAFLRIIDGGFLSLQSLFAKAGGGI